MWYCVVCWNCSVLSSKFHSFLYNLSNNHHVVPSWLVEHTMRRVWFSIQVIVICFIWLQLILYLIVNEHVPLCHVKVCLEFTSLCSAAVLQLVGKTWPPDSGLSAWNITCDVWIGCSAQVIGSPEPYSIRFISKFHRPFCIICLNTSFTEWISRSNSNTTLCWNQIHLSTYSSIQS